MVVPTNGNFSLKDIVMWVLGALMSILLIFGNRTLNSIESKLTDFNTIIMRHERELGTMDSLKGRMDRIEDRERSGIRSESKTQNKSGGS